MSETKERGKGAAIKKTFESDKETCGVLDNAPVKLLQLPDGSFARHNSTLEGVVFGGYECLCAREYFEEAYYCPVNTPLCRIIKPNTYVPDQTATPSIACLTDVNDPFLLYLFPLTLFLFLFFTCLCVASPKGRYSRGYILKILRCWDDDRYEQALRAEIDRMAERARRRQIATERYRNNPSRVYIPGNLPSVNNFLTSRPDVIQLLQESSPRTLLLECKTFSTEATAHDDHHHHPECVICLQPLKDGDRVANIACGHEFHTPCLKSWIKRANHCPLCHAEDLATPQEHEDAGDEEASRNESSSEQQESA